MSVNKSVVCVAFVNRLSSLQQAIIRELGLSDSSRGLGWLPMHAVLHRVFGLPYVGYGREGGPSASQRASLSRSLRRLEQAGYIERQGYSAVLTEAGWSAYRSLTEVGECR